MPSFQRIAHGIDMGQIRQQLSANPQLWDQNNKRRIAPGSPHAQMEDIWVRYGDTLSDGPHFPMWYPAADRLPDVKKLAVSLTGRVGGEVLGGILITKLPPGCNIDRHTDSGWHAGYYEKFYVAINAPPGATFCWDDGVIQPHEGDIWWFRNDRPHWVVNDSNEDRLAAIICVRTDKFNVLKD